MSRLENSIRKKLATCEAVVLSNVLDTVRRYQAAYSVYMII